MSFQVPTNRLHIVQALWGAGSAERGSGPKSSWWQSETLCAQLRCSGLPLKRSGPCGTRGRPIGEAAPGRDNVHLVQGSCASSKALGDAALASFSECSRARGARGDGDGDRTLPLHPQNGQGTLQWGASNKRQVQEHCLPANSSSDCPPSAILLLSPYGTEIHNDHLIQCLTKPKLAKSYSMLLSHWPNAS